MILVLILLFLSIITYPLPDVRIVGQPLAIFLVIFVIIYGALTKKYRITDKAPIFVLLIFLISFLITGLIERDSSNFIEYIINFMSFYLLFLCFSMLSQNSDKQCTLFFGNRLMYLVILTGIILALYGYYGFFTGNIGTQTSLFWWEEAKYWGLHYTESTRNSDVHYIAFPFCALLSKENKKWYDNLLLCFFASYLILSMSRGCWISIITVIMFDQFVLKEKKGRINNILFIIVAAIGGYLLLDYVGMTDYFLDKINSIFSLSSDNVSNSNNERLAIIAATLKIFIKHPLGVGGNNLYYYYKQYGLHLNHAENSYLNIMTELGLPAMIGYVVIIAKPLYIGIQCKRRKIDSQCVNFICLSSLYLLCTSIFNIGLMNCHLWMMIAIVWYVMQYCRKELDCADNTD